MAMAVIQTWGHGDGSREEQKETGDTFQRQDLYGLVID